MSYEMEQLQICRGTGGQMFFRNQKFSVLQVQGREKAADRSAPGSSGPTCTGASAEFLKHLRQPSSALFRDLTPSSSRVEFQLFPAPLSPLSWKWYLHNTFTSYYSVSNTQLTSFILNFVC